MGQGISTTLAALVAEELDVALEQIKVEHGPASWAYYNSAMLEEGGPFAFFDEGLLAETVRARAWARSARFSACKAPAARPRPATASTRCARRAPRRARCSIAAAAQELGVPAGELETADGSILHKASGKSRHLWRGRRERGGDRAAVSADSSRTRPTGSCSASRRSASTCWPRSPARRSSASMSSLPDMLFGTVKMSPRFWAKPVKARPLEGREICRASSRSCRSTRHTATASASSPKTPGPRSGRRKPIEAEWGAPEYPADSAAISKALADALSSAGWLGACATTAMSMPPSPTRRAKGWSRPTMRFPTSPMRPWSR